MNVTSYLVRSYKAFESDTCQIDYAKSEKTVFYGTYPKYELLKMQIMNFKQKCTL